MAVFLDVVKGPMAGESNPYLVPEASYLDSMDRRPRGLRIGVLTDAYGVPLDPAVESETRRVADHLAGLGHRVEDFRPEFDFVGMVDAFAAMWAYLMGGAISAREMEHGRSVTRDDLEPMTWTLWERAEVLLAKDVALAHALMNDVCRRLGGWFEQVDVVLSPIQARPTPEVGGMHRLASEDVEFGEVVHAFFQLIPFKPIANYTGRPAVSLPLARFPDGMPMGMQIMSDLGRDDLLIRMGAQLEDSLPWRERRPPVHVTQL